MSITSSSLVDVDALEKTQEENRKLEKERNRLRKDGKPIGRQSSITEQIIEKEKPKPIPKVKEGYYRGDQGKLFSLLSGSIASKTIPGTSLYKSPKSYKDPVRARNNMINRMRIAGKESGATNEAIENAVEQIKKFSDSVVIEVNDIEFISSELLKGKDK